MFQGTIPASARAILLEAVQNWPKKPIQVLCSGNLTVERSLVSLGREVSGNDVTLYSCALGNAAVGREMRCDVKPEYQERWGWLTEYVKDRDPIRVAATVMLVSQFASSVTRPDNAYFRRLAEGSQHQWPSIFDGTVRRLTKGLPKLKGFHVGGALELLPTLPDDVGVISFPPFWKGGYETMWKSLHALFDWDAPDYAMLTDELKEQMVQMAMSHERWTIALHYRKPELEKYLFGSTLTSVRGMPIFFYGSGVTTRISMPHQKLEPLAIPRLGADEDFYGKLRVVQITAGQFSLLRSEYLNPAIAPAAPQVAFAVLVGKKLVGAFAFTGHQFIGADAIRRQIGPFVYLLSDFPIRPTKYDRLAKLVLYAMASREVQDFMETHLQRRVKAVLTTAFTNKPVSMKYRGMLSLLSRKEPEDGSFKYALNYWREMGEWTLQEGFKEWHEKHVSVQK